MRPRSILSAFAFAAVLSSPAGAAAAPRAPAPETEKVNPAIAEAARVRFNEGLRFYAKKKYSQALAAFLQAHALTGVPAILLNLGQTSLRLGKPLDAARYFQRYLREAKEDAPQVQRARAEKGLADARASLGRLDVSAPEGAEIRVDGAVVGRAPLAESVDVLPGEHDVRMSTPEGAASASVRVEQGATAAVKLGPARAEAPVAAVETREDNASSVPPSSTPASAHEETPGFFSPPSTMFPVHVTGTIAVVALTTAVVLGGMRLNAERNRSTATDALTRNGKDPSACSAPNVDPAIAGTCSSLTDGQRTLDRTNDAYTGALVIGGVASALALGWYFLAPKARSEPAMGLAPVVGPKTAGVSWSARF